MKYFVTGGAGFIGSAFIRQLLAEEAEADVLNFDALTYAGNLENLKAIEDDCRYSFLKADLRDRGAVLEAVSDYAPDVIVHIAAESHVDRSILSPEPVVNTNVNGTLNLLEAARQASSPRFLHVSTDEVYGSLEAPLEADENYPLRTSSPYSASKAASEMLALSYYTTYKLPVSVTRASNNYGPYQFPEKLIPLMIANALEDRELPVYGDGQQVRDWLHVDDHCRAIRSVISQGQVGEIYNIGGSRALPNIEVVRRILAATGKPESLIHFVEDRPGHDQRYALTSQKLEAATGWKPDVGFEEGLAQTVEWYQNNRDWVDRVRSGAYREYYETNYGGRKAALRPVDA